MIIVIKIKIKEEHRECQSKEMSRLEVPVTREFNVVEILVIFMAWGIGGKLLRR